MRSMQKRTKFKKKHLYIKKIHHPNNNNNEKNHESHQAQNKFTHKYVMKINEREQTKKKEGKLCGKRIERNCVYFNMNIRSATLSKC